MIRVAVVDDHPHVAIALRTLLSEIPDIDLVAETPRGGDIASVVRKSKPDVLLLDLLIEPEFDALAGVRGLRKDFPNLKICIFSAFLEPPMLHDLLRAGAHGYILKDDDYVSKIDVILRDLMAGEIYLSPQAHLALAKATREEGQLQPLTERESEILRLAKRGLPNAQIARSLHISPGTVRNHLSSIYRKFDVHSRHAALQVAEERRLI